jgi:hypothetical protein
MVRLLQKVGTSKGIILTRDMIEHLGIEDAIDISIEEGRIVLTAPAANAAPIRRKISVREAGREIIEQYRPALNVLAGKTEEGVEIDE